ncbi:hypothetical protein E2P81_ATG09351 [Venturia nashicola]|nr:hypothetical protein E2P81_ATG09351 [Venturia nashicola]
MSDHHPQPRPSKTYQYNHPYDHPSQYGTRERNAYPPSPAPKIRQPEPRVETYHEQRLDYYDPTVRDKLAYRPDPSAKAAEILGVEDMEDLKHKFGERPGKKKKTNRRRSHKSRDTKNAGKTTEIKRTVPIGRVPIIPRADSAIVIPGALKSRWSVDEEENKKFWLLRKATVVKEMSVKKGKQSTKCTIMLYSALEAVATVLTSWTSGRQDYHEFDEFDMELEEGFGNAALEDVKESDNKLPPVLFLNKTITHHWTVFQSFPDSQPCGPLKSTTFDRQVYAMVASNQASRIPKARFFRRKHQERVVLTSDNMPLSPSPDSAVAFSPWHPNYPTLNVQPIPIDSQLRRKPVSEREMFSTSLSGQTSRAEFSTLESFSPVSMQTSNPISMSRQPSPLSTSTPESTSPVSTAPTSPCSTQAWAPVKTGLFYSNFPDPCGFSGLNKGLFGRDLKTIPRLPPLDMDPTPSKAHKVLGKKAGVHEALRVKEINTVKKTSDRKSRIPSALRKSGFSGVKDDDYYDALPNRLLLATTPSPTRSKIPRTSTPKGFVHVSGSGISTSQSPRSTPEPSPATPSTGVRSKLPRSSAPYNFVHVSGCIASMKETFRTTLQPVSPPYTPHTLSSISGAQKPLAKPNAVTGDEQVIYKTPAVLRASDFANKDSGKAGTSKSWLKIPRSPARGSTTATDRSAPRFVHHVEEESFSTPSRLPLAREIHGKKVMQDVQAMVATPQHRSILPLAISANKPLPPLPADTTSALSPKMQQFNSMDGHKVYLESLQSTEEITEHFSTILTSPESTGDRLFPSGTTTPIMPRHTSPSSPSRFAHTQQHAAFRPEGITTKKLKAQDHGFNLLPTRTTLPSPAKMRSQENLFPPRQLEPPPTRTTPNSLPKTSPTTLKSHRFQHALDTCPQPLPAVNTSLWQMRQTAKSSARLFEDSPDYSLTFLLVSLGSEKLEPLSNDNHNFISIS